MGNKSEIPVFPLQDTSSITRGIFDSDNNLIRKQGPAHWSFTGGASDEKKVPSYPLEANLW